MINLLDSSDDFEMRAVFAKVKAKNSDLRHVKFFLLRAMGPITPNIAFRAQIPM